MSATPSRFKSEFLRTFVARGQYYDCTDPDALDALFGKERVTAYIGFDCTAASLHVGSLVQLMTLRRLQQAGHRPILLMGGGTTKIGDPSGKDETRRLLTAEQIEDNKNAILSGVRHLLKFGDGPSDAIMVDNAEWLDKLEYIPFLRDVRAPLLGQPHADAWRASSSGSSASSRCRSSNSTIRSCRPMTSSSCTGAMAAGCNPAAPTSGAMSSRASIWAAASRMFSSSD